MTTGFDVHRARAAFPALQQKQVYFDNAGGSQTLGTVITSISDYLSKNNVQMGGSYEIGVKSQQKVAEGNEAAARYINAKPSEIVIGSSTTQLFRNLSYAIKWAPGDELIVSKLDHEANISAWVSIAEPLNLKLIWWSAESSKNPKLTAESLEPLLTSKTKLVTCTHASNILGTIHDVKAIASTVHKIPGAMLCVDGVAYMPHRRIDVKDLGVDFYSFSWYKVYGPHCSMLYASEQAQQQIKSLGHYFNPSETLDNKLGLAGGSYELVQSIPKVLDHFGGPHPDKSYTDAIAAHEAALAKILLEYLQGREDITILGESSSDPLLRVPTISFHVKGWGTEEVVRAVEQKSDFAFRWGAFYSKRLCDEILGLGKDGVIRVSMVHYNTEEEISGFVKAFDDVVVKR